MADTKIVEAIQALSPNAEWSVPHNGTVDDIEWLTEGARPSNSEIEAKRVALVNDEPMRLLREERNRKLAETDWWVLPDRTPTQAQLDYRQALRDITETYSSLEEAVFPVKPE
jgi:hypothetical protein